MTVRVLSPALKKKAEKEINEHAKRVAADLDAINTWLKQQPHLHLVRPSDQWLLAFLRGGKFSIEKCKEKLDMYYTIRGITPEIFANRDPMDPKIQELLKVGVFLPLRKLIKEDSSRVCIIRLGVFDASKFQMYDLIKVAIMTTEILMHEDDNFSVAGEELIVDAKHMSVSMLSQFTAPLAKKTISCFEKAMPIRVKKTHFIDTPTGFEAAYKIFKLFLGEKMRKRVQVHNKNYKGMYKSIPKSLLPIEYGGTDGSMHELVEYWKAKVESYRDWFVDQEKVRSDETKRMDSLPKNSAIVFGVEGSFRKLELD